MATDREDGQLRRYLLGVLPDEQCTALEEEYFVRAETRDRVSAAEHDLIDGYLAGRLPQDERARFEQHYLASPVHQHRVAVARQLQRAATAQLGRVHDAAPSSTSLRSIVRSLFEQPLALKVAFAVVVLLIALSAVWLVGLRTPRVEPPTQSAIPPHAPGSNTPTPKPPAPSPVVFAVSLSPVGVRSAEDSPRVTIPAGTDRLRVHLESDGPPHAFTAGRASVRTVSGREVWSGPAQPESPARPPAFAQIDIPADQLPPEDYIVTLFERDGSGREREGLRFFLRIRSR
jgi:hypothetical protein